MLGRRPKICFMRPYTAMNRNPGMPGFCMPTMNFGYRSVESLRQIHALSGNNIGNFIHTEAMSRTLDFDPVGSAVIDLNGAVRLRGAERVADVISERFDVLVFSCANLIRPNVGMQAEVDVFRKLKIPVVIVGAGIQEELADGFAQLSDTLVGFLEFANSSAALWGVRGDLTAEFLSAQGLKNAEPLGCPSFYAMPFAMEAAEPVASEHPRALSAGHIRSRSGPGARYQKVADLLHRIPNLSETSYILQNELFFNAEEIDSLPALDQASHKLDEMWIQKKFFSGAGTGADKVSFYYFGDTSAWRQHCAVHDFYLGDRIHGGVIARQAGKPAVFVYNDARVRELAQKLGAPSISLGSIEKVSGDEVLERFLSPNAILQMQTQYRVNAKQFLTRIERANLSLSGEHCEYLKTLGG